MGLEWELDDDLFVGIWGIRIESMMGNIVMVFGSHELNFDVVCSIGRATEAAETPTPLITKR